MRPEQALSKTMAYCSKREHCKKEVVDKLKKWDIDQDAIESIIDQLVKEKFINEERFAKAYYNDKFRFNKWGNKKIKMMLRAKGISQDLIDNCIAEVNPEEYFNTAMTLAQSKKESLKGSDYEQKGKLFRFLQSRGFESEIILKITNSL